MATAVYIMLTCALILKHTIHTLPHPNSNCITLHCIELCCVHRIREWPVIESNPSSFQGKGGATRAAQLCIGIVDDSERGSDELLVVVHSGAIQEAEREVINHHFGATPFKYPETTHTRC